MGVIKALRSIIRKNSTGSEYTGRRINFIEGSNVTLTVAQDSTDNEVDVTIASTGGSGSPAGSDTQIQYNNGGSFGGASQLTYDDANNRVGINKAAPDEKLHVVGNFQVDDADTATKGYRFRTGGGELDLDASGTALNISTFSSAGFGGTQRTFLKLKADADYAAAYKNWEFKDGSDNQQHLLSPTSVVFNETGANADFRVEGDTDANALVVDASADKVGIGTASPSEKLEVNGNIELSNATDNIKVNGANPKKNVYIPAAAMWPSTTAGCAALAKTEAATNDVNYQTLDFDQTTQEYAEFQMAFPDNWDASTVTFYAHWTASAGTGGVAWSLEGLALADDDAIDTARGTAVVVTDTLIATGDVHKTSESSAVTLSNTPAAGDLVMFRVSRVTGNGSDTLTGDAKLIGIRIEYGVSAFSA